MNVNPTHNFLAVDDFLAICAAWQSYKGFTIRPVPSTEAYYHAVISQCSERDQPLLLYGGTPEIRSAIYLAGRRVTIVDRSEVMIRAMGLLTAGKAQVLPNERLVVDDWRKVNLDDHGFRLALGDDAVNMVDWPSFGPFMQEAHRLLASDGMFACHLLVQPPEHYRRQTIADIFAEYDAGTIGSFYELASRVNFAFYDEETYRMGWQQSIAGLKRLLADHKIASDYGFIETFQSCNSVFACPPQSQWEDLIQSLFSIENIFYPDEYEYCRFEPLYLLRKR